MKQRFKKIVLYLVAAGVLGCIYAVFVEAAGWALPCLFHSITGLACPGCGVTRMCLSIIHLDFEAAFLSNQMLFLLLPVLFYLFGSYTLGYVKTGRWMQSRVQTVLTYICIGLLLVYFVYRNICTG